MPGKNYKNCMNETIILFIQKQTCATVCCVDENNKPYCFSCFYAFNAEDGLLYFKSSSGAHHSSLIKKNAFIAGTVLPDKLNTLLVKGIQFEGVVLDANHSLVKNAARYYHKKYPIALAMQGEISVIQITHIKMTDSTKGFGKKITWSRG
jgi:uncharacterized protein YhbP (UPF0306 family)